jgi:hypothetical protein
VVLALPNFDGRAACADPALLPLIDFVFDHPKSAEAYEVGNTLCRRCSVAEQCLSWAVSNDEPGFWGGTAPHARSGRVRRRGRAARNG